MDTLVCDSQSIRTSFCAVEDKDWNSSFQKGDSKPYT